jgi:hypothetical protein
VRHDTTAAVDCTGAAGPVAADVYGDRLRGGTPGVTMPPKGDAIDHSEIGDWHGLDRGDRLERMERGSHCRHGVTRDEVDQVVRGDPFITRGRNRTYRVIRQTDGGRYPSDIVARRGENRYFVVTARDADPEERRLLRRH